MLPEVYPGRSAGSVMLEWYLLRVGKVAGSEATTTKRWNAIPLIHINFVERTCTSRRVSTTYAPSPLTGRALFLR